MGNQLSSTNLKGSVGYLLCYKEIFNLLSLIFYLILNKKFIFKTEIILLSNFNFLHMFPHRTSIPLDYQNNDNTVDWL